MHDITGNEMLIALKILKTPEGEFNANSISKEIGITSMGALKILKRLENEGILASKIAGKATFYKFNFAGDYAKHYAVFALKNEAEHAQPYARRWIKEIRKLKNANVAILFGSVLRKGKEAHDVDVLALASQNKFGKLKEEVVELNKINEKHMHIIYQSPKDLRSNIKKQDKIVLGALKGIVAFGEDKLIEVFS